MTELDQIVARLKNDIRHFSKPPEHMELSYYEACRAKKQYADALLVFVLRLKH